MSLQSIFPRFNLTLNNNNNSNSGSSILSLSPPLYGNYIRCRQQKIQLGDVVKCHKMPMFSSANLPTRKKVVFYLPNSDKGLGIDTVASVAEQGGTLNSSDKIENTQMDAAKEVFDHRELFRGKSGSVSFCGLTHQFVEEGKLVSSPFKDGTGSLFWVLGPIALISSLVLPQFILSTIVDAVLKDEILADIVMSFISEVMFYVGLATFLLVTDHVQQPYLEFSPKRWSLITGLRGYLSSAFFTMGVKVFVPLLAVSVAWPILGLPAAVAVAPFLLGCAAQLAFEACLNRNRSSCWPLVPIIFEVYRLYQLSRGAHLIESLMFSMKGSSMTPELLEKSGALVSMLVVLQVLGIVCLWSLLTFLLRLFPSRPVAERY